MFYVDDHISILLYVSGCVDQLFYRSQPSPIPYIPKPWHLFSAYPLFSFYPSFENKLYQLILWVSHYMSKICLFFLTLSRSLPILLKILILITLSAHDTHWYLFQMPQYCWLKITSMSRSLYRTATPTIHNIWHILILAVICNLMSWLAISSFEYQNKISYWKTLYRNLLCCEIRRRYNVIIFQHINE